MSQPVDQIDAVFSGVKHAWAYVLGPFSAMLVGTVLGVFAATGLGAFGGTLAHLPALSIVVVPIHMFVTNVGQLLAFATAIGILMFWWSAALRLNGWMIICIAFGLEAFRMFDSVGGGQQTGRIALACAAMGLAYSILYYLPIRQARLAKKAHAEARAAGAKVRWRPFKRPS